MEDSPVVSEDVGQPVSFTIDTVRVDNDWGWLVVQPQASAGGEIDWSQTKYATQAAEGVLDGGGTTYALLRRQGGAWTVVDLAVGPTDAAYIGWPQRYGAPASLITP
jgi:hypothetical protein